MIAKTVGPINVKTFENRGDGIISRGLKDSFIFLINSSRLTGWKASRSVAVRERLEFGGTSAAEHTVHSLRNKAVHIGTCITVTMHTYT